MCPGFACHKPRNIYLTGSGRCAGDPLNPFQQVKLEVGTDEDLLSLEGLSIEQVLQSGTPLLANGGQVKLLQVSTSFCGHILTRKAASISIFPM